MKRLFASVLLLLPLITFANEDAVWVESDGMAIMGEAETSKEVKERAKIDAQYKAIEKAVGVFLKSSTLVINSQLSEDLIFASVRGAINKTEIISGGWDEKDRNIYRVKLKVLVQPVHPERGEGFALNLSLSKTSLVEGDEVKIFYQSNKDCYVYVFSVAADGSVTLLLPNSMNMNNHIKADDVHEFPPAESRMRLKAMLLPDFKGMVADEKIKIIATLKDEKLVPLGFREGMYTVYDAKSTGMINDLVKRLNQLDPADWADATATYRIKKR
jgi:hypothetical protein